MTGLELGRRLDWSYECLGQLSNVCCASTRHCFYGALRKADRNAEILAVLKRLIAAHKAQSEVQKRRYKFEVVSDPGDASTRR